MWPLKRKPKKPVAEKIQEKHRKKSDAPDIKPRSGAKKHEVDAFKAEVKKSKALPMEIPKKGKPVPQKKKKKERFEVLPTRVGNFDSIIEDGGFERGAIILLSGGAGTGKTTFSLQSLYHGVLKGEKAIYLTFEEPPEGIKRHMLKNYKWDLQKMEDEKKFAFVEVDPAKIARSVEAMLAQKSGELKIELEEFKLPFTPDRIALDSLSALAIAFGDEENYRRYIMELFDLLRSYNAVSIVLSETEQNPKIYSRTGVEEFLADGVVVLYNLKVDGKRLNALEILKLRSSKHEKQMVPYRITSNGIQVDYLDLLSYRKENESLMDVETRKMKKSKKKKAFE